MAFFHPMGIARFVKASPADEEREQTWGERELAAIREQFMAESAKPEIVWDMAAIDGLLDRRNALRPVGPERPPGTYVGRVR